MIRFISDSGQQVVWHGEQENLIWRLRLTNGKGLGPCWEHGYQTAITHLHGLKNWEPA